MTYDNVRCHVEGCSNRKVKGDSSISLYRCPPDPIVRQAWIDALGLKELSAIVNLRKMLVCSAHFQEKEFQIKKTCTQSFRYLRAGAIPTLKLPSDKPPVVEQETNSEATEAPFVNPPQSESSQTDDPLTHTSAIDRFLDGEILTGVSKVRRSAKLRTEKPPCPSVMSVKKQSKAAGPPKQRTANPQLPVPAEVNIPADPPKAAPNKPNAVTPDVPLRTKSQPSQELAQAREVIQALYQKLRTLLLENIQLKAIIKKHNLLPRLENLIGTGRPAGSEVTPRPETQDDVILEIADESFLVNSKKRNTGRVTTLVVGMDGTVKEKTVGGPVKTKVAPKPSRRREIPKNVVPKEQSILEPEPVTDHDYDAKVLSPVPEGLWDDVLSADEDPDVAIHPFVKDHNIDVNSSQGEQTDCLSDVANLHSDGLPSAAAPEVSPEGAKLHSCGVCGHRTDTQEEMLLHIANHMEYRSEEENPEPQVDEGSSVPERVMAAGDSIVPDENPSANVQLTDKTHAYTPSVPKECERVVPRTPPRPKKRRKKTHKFFCHLCDYKSLLASAAISHLKGEHNAEPDPAMVEASKRFVCGLCEYFTDSSGNMKRHMSTHAKVKPFACDQCDYRASLKVYLTGHIETVHNRASRELANVHKCDECTFTTANEHYLKYHKRRVHNVVKFKRVRKFQCELCDKKFATHGTYSVHRKSHDRVNGGESGGKRTCSGNGGTPASVKMPCDICFKMITGFGPLQRHREACFKARERLLTISGADSDVLSCIACSAKFQTREEGLAHDCPSPNFFACSFCEYTTSSGRQALERHMMRHTGEKPHECKECHRRFRNHAHLKCHMMTHTGEKPFSCSYCLKTFAVKWNMLKHQQIHTGEKSQRVLKDLSCMFCDYKTRERKSLKKHVETHHYAEEDEEGDEIDTD